MSLVALSKAGLALALSLASFGARRVQSGVALIVAQYLIVAVPDSVAGWLRTVAAAAR